MEQTPSVPADSTPVTPEPPYRRPLNLVALPFLSVAERARRWAAVEQMLVGRDLQGIVIPPAQRHRPELQAVARYLTHIGPVPMIAVVVPRDGTPACFVPRADLWVSTQPWCHEICEVHADPPTVADAWARGITERLPLGRLGVVTGRAGAAGLAKLAAGPLAQRDLVDVTSDLDQLRAGKSPEEVAFLERALHITDATCRSVCAAWQPDTSEAAILSLALRRLCAQGSEIPHQRNSARVRTPAGRHPDSGELVTLHLAASWSGYGAVIKRPIRVGSGLPEDAEQSAILAACWDIAVDGLGPGLTVARYLERMTTVFTTRGPGRANLPTVQVALRGQGLGCDLPARLLQAGPTPTGNTEFQLPTGWCGTLEVRVGLGAQRLVWAESVLLTTRAARRLGNVPVGIITTEQ